MNDEYFIFVQYALIYDILIPKKKIPQKFLDLLLLNILTYFFNHYLYVLNFCCHFICYWVSIKIIVMK